MFEYQKISGHESWGEFHLGVQILVGGITLSEEEVRFVQNHCPKIHDGLLLLRAKKQAREDPEKIAEHDECVKKLVDCFPDQPIHVKEISNGYCSEYCCVNIPWLVVTTSRGPITIGWRKRVISIDWSQLDTLRWPADELFPNEDVTKHDHLIHAYGYEKATEYLGTILK